MPLLYAILFAGPMADLGHPDWSRRESADARLRSWGLLAVPAWLDATRSENPEVRFRAVQALGKWRSLAADLRAAAMLTDPWPIDPAVLWNDEDLRFRIHRIAVANGCDKNGPAAWLLPDAYTQCGWFFNWMPVMKCAIALTECKHRLGFGYGPYPYPFLPR
jgi:hypothetical protein